MHHITRFWLPLIGVVVVACGSDDTPTPPRMATDSLAPAFVAASDTAPVAATSPASRPEAWRLAFVDVETTGLVPGWHEMIDLGVVMTDLDGRALDSLFIRIQPSHPERTADGARAVNAFDAERWRQLGALAPAAAVDSLRAFHRRVAGSGPVLLVAFNSQFDAAFLDHLFRAEGASWRELYHYFVLDIPSMAWALGYRELTGAALADHLGVEDEPHVADEHTGITGARLNARLYRALRARGMGAPVAGTSVDTPAPQG
ncbi:MAG TPA: 3'-5' exonuclease [Gemmatimonadota bacterium]|nr:3'-5' exonuclease [Gemmatimonadota bacterium]